MKQVININFQGRVVPIEVTAFEMLKSYTESLSRHFAAEEGRDEIINDIENRIGELFQERLKSGATCITEDDVNAIIRSMGRPEEFDAEQGSFSEEPRTPQPESAPFQSKGKRLYRSENEKVIGGVCSGLANYFGIDVVIVRVIFVLLFFLGGMAFIAYLILWIAVPSTASTEIGSVRKKLYRDNDDKIIAGVCSGIGNYFGINAWIPRVLFLIPFLTIWGDWGGDFMRLGFSPGSIFVYIILWLVIPEALTTAEKLEMKGEKVDLNSIKNSVVEEMKGVHERATRLGKEAGAVAAEKSKAFGAEVGSVAKRGGRSFGDIIALLFKIFAYFILGCIVFAIVVGLFAFGIAAVGLFPLKEFVLRDGWQNVFAWGTLIFFIAVPIIGIVTWLIRKLARIKRHSKMMRLSFSAMWIIGWVSIIMLIALVSKDFRASNTIVEEEVMMGNPGVSRLEITSQNPDSKFYRDRWFTLEPFDNLDDDTAFVKNVEINIVKATTDSFRVSMARLVNGRSRNDANYLASLMEFNVVQQDSVLLLDKGIPINRRDKFRNQRIILTVYVPVGKQIRIDRSIGRPHNIRFGGPWANDWELNFDADVEQGWDTNTDYIMREDGLYTLDGQPADSWNPRNRSTNRIHLRPDGIQVETNGSSDDDYRYDNKVQSLDSIKQNVEREQQKIRDSLERQKEIIDRQLNKISEPATMLNVVQVYNPLALMN